MNYRKCLAAGLMIAATVAMPRFANATDGNQLMEYAREYEKLDQDPTIKSYRQGWFMGFVSGVWNASPAAITPRGVMLGQVCAVVIKYLKAHPEKWNEAAFFLVISAIRESWPEETRAAPAGR